MPIMEHKRHLKRNFRDKRNGDNKFFKRTRFEVGERLKETDVGITERVGSCECFVGTLKERFSDFQVHEIGLDGEIVKLTSEDLPPGINDHETVENLTKLVSKEAYEKLQEFSNSAESVNSTELDVTDLDKEQRRAIHDLAKKFTNISTETETKNDRKVITICKTNSSKSQGSKQKRNDRMDWTRLGGDYCQFVLHKVNMDTMDALNQISRHLHLKANLFNYAGTKDRRAMTSQWISIKKVRPRDIFKAAQRVRGAYVGNFKFSQTPLKLGMLYGNRFTIALRNVQASNEVLDTAMISLRDKGFVNYYGLQRFGTIAAIPTHEIGKSLLQGNWTEAVNLILKPRDGEQDENLAEARKIYKETGDAQAAHKKIGQRVDKIEANLLRGIIKCGKTNLRGALDVIPKNIRLMYMHAYQSFMWNRIVSRRIKEFGLEPIAGDIVYENPGAIDEEVSIAEDHQGINENSTDKTTENNELKNDGNQCSNVENDQEEKDKTNTSSLPPVKVLTQDDLPNYQISDVVLPLPGWKIVYPSYAKSWYEEYLQKDGLTMELKQKDWKYSLGGSYRKMLEIPTDLSWKMINYDEKVSDLIPSDVDVLKGNEPPKDIANGKYKALIIQLSLKSSSYATMALREILKHDTSQETHAAQSAAFHENETKHDEKLSDPTVDNLTNAEVHLE